MAETGPMDPSITGAGGVGSTSERPSTPTPPAPRPEAPPVQPTPPAAETAPRKQSWFERRREGRRETGAEDLKDELNAARSRLYFSQQRIDNLPAGPERNAEATRLQEEMDADRKAVARANIDLLRRGEIREIQPKDLEIILEDMADNYEQSALAEVMLSRQGFKTFQDSLRTLKVNMVDDSGHLVSLPQGESGISRFIQDPAVKEQLKKLGISSGLTAAVAGTTILFTGPVGWTVAAAGAASVVGGAVGRMAGEFIRTRMLQKREREYDSAGNLLRDGQFNQMVADSNLRTILDLQTEATNILEELRLCRGPEYLGEVDTRPDPNTRAQMMMEFVTRASQIDGRVAGRYRTMERNARLIKAGCGLLGAVGGGVAEHALIGHSVAEAIQSHDYHKELAEAARSGMRFYYTPDGAMHVAHDPNLGHIVKQSTDHVWRFVINSDAHHVDTKNALTEANHEGLNSYQSIYHYFAHAIPESVPGHGGALPQGQEFLHMRQLTGVDQAVQADVTNTLEMYNWLVPLIGIAPTVLTESAYTSSQFGKDRQARSENRQLVRSLEDVESHLQHKVNMGVGEYTPVGVIPNEPGRMVALLENLARYYGDPMPQGPFDRKLNWEVQPQPLPNNFDVRSLSIWQEVGDERIITEGSTTSVYNGLHREPITNDRGVEERDQYGNIEFSHTRDRNGEIHRSLRTGTMNGRDPIVGVVAVDARNNRIATVEAKENTVTHTVTWPVTVRRLDKFLERYQLVLRNEDGRPIDNGVVLRAGTYPGGEAGAAEPSQQPIPQVPDVGHQEDQQTPQETVQGGEAGADQAPQYPIPQGQGASQQPEANTAAERPTTITSPERQAATERRAKERRLDNAAAAFVKNYEQRINNRSPLKFVDRIYAYGQYGGIDDLTYRSAEKSLLITSLMDNQGMPIVYGHETSLNPLSLDKEAPNRSFFYYKQTFISSTGSGEETAKYNELALEFNKLRITKQHGVDSLKTRSLVNDPLYEHEDEPEVTGNDRNT